MRPKWPSELLPIPELLGYRVEVPSYRFGEDPGNTDISVYYGKNGNNKVMVRGYGSIAVDGAPIICRHPLHGIVVLVMDHQEEYSVRWAEVDIISRPISEPLEEILGLVFPVLDQGFVRVVDYMGGDSSVVRAARVAYGAGTKRIHEDEGLIRYCMRHRHTTPFEHAELALHVRVPMDCWRQWIRHRTACLAGDVVLSFDLPGGKTGNGNPRHYPLTVAEVYRRWQPTENRTRPDKQRNPLVKRERVQRMSLRSLDEETGKIYYTRVTDIWESGVKMVIRVEFPGGRTLRASADHRCLTDQGWMGLRKALEAGAGFIGFGRDAHWPEQGWPVIDESAEEWRFVEGFGGRYRVQYEVSSQGRVRSSIAPGGKEHTRVVGARIKQQTIDTSGYAVVSMSSEGKTRAYRVANLVALAFLGECPPGLELLHANHNRQDSRLLNLSYGTRQQNNANRVSGGCSQRLASLVVRAVGWREDGEEMTYDLSVDGPYHNFYAGGVVVHNSVNEYSTRYSEAIDAVQQTDPERWRLQSGANRQGSSGFLAGWPGGDIVELEGSPGLYLTQREEMLHNLARTIYEERLELGVAREQARKDLPLSTYTEAYWKCDLHNLLHFLALRMDSHAQEEIRAYATIIGEEIVARWVPMTWAAFKDYRLNAMSLSARDTRMVSLISGGLIEEALAAAIEYRWLPGDVAMKVGSGKTYTLPSNRERQEFEVKIHLLGWKAPWEV